MFEGTTRSSSVFCLSHLCSTRRGGFGAWNSRPRTACISRVVRHWSQPGPFRKALLAGAFGTALLAGATHAASRADPGPSDTRSYGAAMCRVEKPIAWKGGQISWIGGCATGHANGLGVLRSVVDGSAPELFAGSVKNGFLSNGVLITEGGYIAGNWKNGAVVQEGVDDQANRNVILAAFEIAAKAADAVSKVMAHRSNPEGSRFYAKIATRLRNQMD